MKNFDSYYDPPDEEEAQFCESCGQELEDLPMSQKISRSPELFCHNPFCPERFRAKSIEQEMAEALVVAVDTVSYLKGRVAHLNRLVNIYDPDWRYEEG